MEQDEDRNRKSLGDGKRNSYSVSQPKSQSETSDKKLGKKRAILKLLVLIVAIIIMAIVASVVYFGLSTHHREFCCFDQEIMHTHLDGEESVPSWAAVLSGFLFLALSVLGTDLMNYYTQKHRGSRQDAGQNQILCSMISFLVGFAAWGATLMLVGVGKKVVGDLRPDFLEVCFGSRRGYLDFCESQAAALNVSYAIPFYVEGDVCTNPDMSDSDRESFPSGHAALVCAPAFFALIYINLQLRSGLARMVTFVWQLAILGVTWWISVSRVADNRHHYRDVCASAAISLSISLLFYLFLHLTNKYDNLHSSNNSKGSNDDT